MKVGDRVAIMPAIVCQRCHWCRQGLGHLCIQLRLHRPQRRDRRPEPVRRAQGVPARRAARRGVSDLEGAVVEPAVRRGLRRRPRRGARRRRRAGHRRRPDRHPVGDVRQRHRRLDGDHLRAEPQPGGAGPGDGHRPGRRPDARWLRRAASPRLTGGLGVDVGVECSGSTPGLAACITSARPRGTVVQTGLHTKPATLDAMALSEQRHQLVGSWCYLITDWPRIIRLIASGKYPVSQGRHRQTSTRGRRHQGFRRARRPDGRPAQGARPPTLAD